MPQNMARLSWTEGTDDQGVSHQDFDVLADMMMNIQRGYL